MCLVVVISMDPDIGSDLGENGGVIDREEIKMKRDQTGKERLKR